MGEIFLTLLHMSVTAGYMILAVVVLRVILKKAPKWIICLLWGLVGVRLACPVSVKSVFSLIPRGETLPREIGAAPYGASDPGNAVFNGSCQSPCFIMTGNQDHDFLGISNCTDAYA